MQVGVFCASASGLEEIFLREARILGEGLADRGHGLVYGGGDVGLMREVARAAHSRGGHVAGYIPERLMAIEGRAYRIADELVVTDSMHERKRAIFARSDAFVTLAGGVGTLEEFMEVITLRNLGYHDKPVLLVNTDGFFDDLISFLTTTTDRGFSPPLGRLYHVVPDAPGALDRLDALK